MKITKILGKFFILMDLYFLNSGYLVYLIDKFYIMYKHKL